MAYTSIIPVHRLDNSIQYVKDKEKTTKKADPAGSLEEAIDYALNREKTERAVFESAIGCTCEGAYLDMVTTKQRFHKMDGVQGYHLIQSFAEGEVTPELAHLIGLELAEQLLKGRFEAVITTHLNTAHYHNHLVFNSVSMEDGMKYRSNAKSYYQEVRRASDSLCRKYGLSIIQPANGKGKPYAEWQAERDGKPTWRTGIRMDIREAVQECFTWRQFLHQMEQKGYVWKLDQKYTALKAPGMERYVRLKSLGKGYTEAAIRERILSPGKRTAEEKGKAPEARKKPTGLQALYYAYLYQMGAVGKRPKRASYLARSDIRRLDERIAQMEFLQKHGITTREGLEAYRKPLEEQIIALTKERHKLYRKEPGCRRIAAIGEELKGLRKEVKMCVQIEQHSAEIQRRMDAAERLRMEQEQKKKEQAEKKQERRRPR